MKQSVLIIGAGVAGITAAARLSELGVKSILVEKSPLAGGNTAHLPCKATESCAKCGACLLEESASEPGLASGVEKWFSAELAGLQKTTDGYNVELSAGPVYMDETKCTSCGLCLDACPEKGRAVRRSFGGFGPLYGLFDSDCIRFTGGDCSACADVCPEGAIDFEAESRTEKMSVSAVVMAGGYTPFDPDLKPRYGHARLDDVVSALEMDEQLRARGEFRRPSDGAEPGRVAFVQCVGSRDKVLGRDYCSRVCCGYALRMARLMKHRRPDTAVSFFYMDIQNAGRGFAEKLRKTSEEVELIHGVPGEIAAGEGGELLVPYVGGQDGARQTRPFDMVVLSVGLGPPDGGLLSMLGLERNVDGFPVARPGEGIFVAGAANGPMGVAESRASALGAAEAAAGYVKSR